MSSFYGKGANGCAVEGCERFHHARGWCSSHYDRWRRTGEPGPARFVSNGEPLRWLKDVVPTAGVGCIRWPFGKDAHGYGALMGDRKAHHVALELVGRERPPGAICRHLCGVPDCVNPDHLAWGTALENSHDRYAHGTVPMGSDHPGAALTEAAVRAMRKRHAAGESIASLAAEFGVHDSTAHSAIHRNTWRHVT